MIKTVKGGDQLFRCEECGAIFDEPKSYEENIGEFWGFPATETFYVCPVCKGDCIEEYKEEEESKED